MLDYKYLRAAELKIAEPEMSWTEIAEQVGISERQLRRVRNEDPEWKAHWDQADKETMIETLRRKCLASDPKESNNASLWRLYFEVTGQMDPIVEESLLGMKDEEALILAGSISEWYRNQQTESSPYRSLDSV